MRMCAAGQIMFGVMHQGLRPTWPAGRHPHLQPLFHACTAADAHCRPPFTELLASLHALDEALKAELASVPHCAAPTGMATAAAGAEGPSTVSCLLAAKQS